jgi:hypothetical protein
VREPGRCEKLFVRRVVCKGCRATHALLPSFLFARRRDTATVIGAAVVHVGLGRGGARPAALVAEVPHTTARGWLRRFRRRAPWVATAFAAAAVELGGEVVVPVGGTMKAALAAIGAAFAAGRAMPGWGATEQWCFASVVSGGELLGANTISPFLQLGRRRFMPPVPTTEGETCNEESENG